MSTCTFFGHRDSPQSIKPNLREAIIELIEHHNVRRFYVGNHGNFDLMARSILRDLSHQYSQISYAVVLAYLPAKQSEETPHDFSDTLLPEGIEAVPRRYAISWRNNWMLRQSDYVITFLDHSWGSAAQFAEKAEKAGKTVIHIST